MCHCHKLLSLASKIRVELLWWRKEKKPKLKRTGLEEQNVTRFLDVPEPRITLGAEEEENMLFSFGGTW